MRKRERLAMFPARECATARESDPPSVLHLPGHWGVIPQEGRALPDRTHRRHAGAGSGAWIWVDVPQSTAEV